MESFLIIVEEKNKTSFFLCIFSFVIVETVKVTVWLIFLCFFYIKIGFFGKLRKINFNWIFFEIKSYSLYYNDLESF